MVQSSDNEGLYEVFRKYVNVIVNDAVLRYLMPSNYQSMIECNKINLWIKTCI